MDTRTPSDVRTGMQEAAHTGATSTGGHAPPYRSPSPPLGHPSRNPDPQPGKPHHSPTTTPPTAILESYGADRTTTLLDPPTPPPKPDISPTEGPHPPKNEPHPPGTTDPFPHRDRT